MRPTALVVLAFLLAPVSARAEDPPEARPETLWDLLLEKYDKDADGVLSKTEYTRGASAFATLDRNDDDVLTKADFPRGPAPGDARPGAGAPFGGPPGACPCCGRPMGPHAGGPPHGPRAEGFPGGRRGPPPLREGRRDGPPPRGRPGEGPPPPPPPAPDEDR
jgi:hypothetical protein